MTVKLKMKITTYYDRPCLHNKHRNVYLDEYAYSAVLANIIRAKKCLKDDNINEYYGLDGWTLLLLHYISSLRLLIDAYPQSILLISITDYNRLVMIYNSKSIMTKGMWIEHTTCLKTYKDILHFTIVAASAIQTIMENELSFKPELISKLVIRNLEDSEIKHVERGVKRYNRQHGNNK